MQILLESGAYINWQQTAGETALMKVSGLPDRLCAMGITNKISLLARLYLTHLKLLNRKLKMKNGFIWENGFRVSFVRVYCCFVLACYGILLLFLFYGLFRM